MQYCKTNMLIIFRYLVDMSFGLLSACNVCVHVYRLRCCLGKWREVVAKRERKREQTADELHHMMLRRRAWNHWREVGTVSGVQYLLPPKL